MKTTAVPVSNANGRRIYDFEVLELAPAGNRLSCANQECRDPEPRFVVGISPNTITLTCTSCQSKQLIIVNREIYVDKHIAQL